MNDLGLIRPPNLDEYWAAVADELEGFPARPEEELIPLRCTEFARMYGVRLTGIGPYRLFGYLSIPAGTGPFPAIYWAPKYSSVLEPIPQGTPNLIRSRYVTFSCAGRGQRNADQPYAAMFPGQLTAGIEGPRSYIFRGIAADAVRGLEYLMGRPEVDASRVVSIGNDLALMAGALGAGVTHAVVTPALFVDTLRLAGGSSAYPLEEINDYLRLHPDRADEVRTTLDYFNLRWTAPGFGGSTLLMTGPRGSVLDADAVGPLVEALPGGTNVHESESSSFKDGLFVEQWITEQLGFDEPILPEHWR